VERRPRAIAARRPAGYKPDDSTQEDDMAIKAGDTLPADLKLKEMTEAGPKDVTVGELTKGKRVVFFAVPGAFTPTCSMKHLPGFLEHSSAIRAKGVDEIVCLSVNDAFVMGAWGEANKAKGKVRMLADGNGDFTKAVGLGLDASGFGMGARSQRYAMIVKDGKVEQLAVDASGLKESSAESVLAKL
jgi:peroxiredoxin